MQTIEELRAALATRDTLLQAESDRGVYVYVCAHARMNRFATDLPQVRELQELVTELRRANIDSAVLQEREEEHKVNMLLARISTLQRTMQELEVCWWQFDSSPPLTPKPGAGPQHGSAARAARSPAAGQN